MKDILKKLANIKINAVEIYVKDSNIYPQIYNWCNDQNITYFTDSVGLIRPSHIFRFVNEEDAVLFKLKFNGKFIKEEPKL